MQYTIVGDTASHKGCLIYVIAGDKALADRTLKRITESPTDEDKYITRNMSNIRIAQTDGGWWKDSFLAN